MIRNLLRTRRAAPTPNQPKRRRYGKPTLEHLEDRVVPVTPVASWAGNAQHTAISSVASQPLSTIHWETKVDNFPSSRFAHYGAPLITLANTVILPYKTTTTGDFHVQARSGIDGSLIWDVTSDWSTNYGGWYPSYQPVLSTFNNRLYFAGANGSLYYRDNVDSSTGTTTHVTVFGTAGNIINTSLTADSLGNIYFGYRNGPSGGIAKVTPSGAVTTVAANVAAGDSGINWVQNNEALALSNDEQTVYVTVRSSSTSYYGRLLGLRTSDLTTQYNSGVLKDPRDGGVNNAGILDDSTASPLVAPDGKVFLGVFGNPYNGSRGWLLQFSADLATQGTPGGFGWDATPTIIPPSMVDAMRAAGTYTGTSSYLLFSKYNNYYGISDGGDGSNRIAVLDPNDTEVEFHPSSHGLLVMKRVITQLGPTHDWDYPSVPTAVREWCINFGTVDPLTNTILTNSADGKFYRWDVLTNTLSESLQLTSGIGQPYTMTVVGVDGTVYGIQIGKLFAMGVTPQLSVSDPVITEGTGGTTFATFTVTLNYPRTVTGTNAITVHYATADGTAVAGSDYTATSGTLTFLPSNIDGANPNYPTGVGETSKTITVPINPDALDEFDETFVLNLSDATGADILDGTGQATIVDDDGPPSLAINDISINEGDAGTTAATFTVSLSAASGKTITVNYATADGTATTADNDYQGLSGSLTFAPGETSKTVTVSVNGDTAFEPSETFFVNLTGAVNATLADGQGQGTIVNDDDVPSLAINDVSVTEGGTANFTVTLSNPSSQAITVGFATADGTAGSSDYTGGSGTLTFAPGETSKTISVATTDDALNENAETFFVNLSNANNAFISDGQGQGTILDNDTAPSLSIGDVSAFEGAAGTTGFTFTVTLSAPSGRSVSVNYATGDGTATTADGDYQAASGTLTFAAGEITKTITVLVNGDIINEPDEAFYVNLSGADGATIADSQGQGTILNDDALVLSVNDVTATEGDSGTTGFTFTFALSSPGSSAVSVNYSTADGTATAADSDYQPVTGTVTFAPGETSKTFTVLVNGDTKNEADETFFVNLSGASGGTIGDGQGQGTITNDDPVPSITIPDLSTVEGDYGFNTTTVYVYLSAPSGQTVTVHYETRNGTASSTSATRDYIDTFGDLTFAPGQTVASFQMTIVGDTIDELDETILVDLSSPTNATIARDEAVVTILDDDTSTAYIYGASVTEGNSGQTAVQLNVSLSVPSDRTVTIDYLTEDETALAGSDYVAASGTLTFGPGQTAKTVTVYVNGDVVDESNEVFVVELQNPTGGAVINADYGEADVTILDDDTSSISVNDVSVVEGNTGTTPATFTLNLSTPADHTITVEYATGNGTAHAPSDYQAASGTVTFAAGETSKSVTVLVNGDTALESDETFLVNLSNATGGATIGDAQGQGTILNDDTVPALTIDDVTVTEGNSGTTAATFTVSLSAPAVGAVTVRYATANGTAVAPGDYTAVSGTLRFAPGETSKMITVLVKGDTLDESDETFFVLLSNVTGKVVIGDGRGVGTILDDDTSAIRVNDVSVVEGNTGTRNATFTVSLSVPADHPISVRVATADGTAVAPGDYTAVSGTLTFAAGQTGKAVAVAVRGDTLDESDETFFLNLSGATGGATIADGQGVGTIIDDDTSRILINDVSVVEGNSGTTAATFTVSLSTPADHAFTVDYATADNTALSPGDYQAASGTLTFAAGQTSKAVTVLVNGDTLDEFNETFFVNLSNATGGAVIGDSRGVGTIVDDDTARISINDVSVVEGNSGTTAATFTVSLSTPADHFISVNFAPANGTAVAPADYVGVSGMVPFAPGETSKSVTVLVNGDRLDESDETFFVILSAPTGGAVIARARGVGTIIDDDTATIAISDVSLAEGNSGFKAFAFVVTLSNPSAQTVTVRFATANGTAAAGSDYAAVGGTLTFAPGQTSKTIMVLVKGDTLREADETFFVNLSNATGGAVLGDLQGVGIILNDD
jgi:hypothetical protein